MGKKQNRLIPIRNLTKFEGSLAKIQCTIVCAGINPLV